MRCHALTYIIRRMAIVLCILTTFSFMGCDVHEFPNALEKESLRIKMNFHSFHFEMDKWEYHFTTKRDIEVKSESTDAPLQGTMRYIVRAYAVINGRTTLIPSQEAVFYRYVANDNYDHEEIFDLAPGTYDVMAWADFISNEGIEYNFYDATDFSGITLEEYEHSTDYRDAFRGIKRVTITSSTVEHTPLDVDILMERPLSKYEFITTDLREFINEETTRAEAKNKAQSTEEDVVTKVNMDNYQIRFFYTGFLPNKYNMFIDRTVNSTTGTSFSSKITPISDEEASIGFDYVFMNPHDTSVSVQIAIYGEDGTQISLSQPIEIPLKRSTHTMMKGKFLTTRTSGGVVIDPSFKDDINIPLYRHTEKTNKDQ